MLISSAHKHRRVRTGAKDERTAIARRQTEQFARRFGDPELLGCPNDLLQRLQLLALLSDEQFGVTDDVDEKDMPDLESKIVLRFRRHSLFLLGPEAACDVFPPEALPGSCQPSALGLSEIDDRGNGF